MANILILASETIGGGELLDAVRKRAAEGDARFYVVVPQTRPRHGAVIYDEAVRDSAQVRVDLMLAFMRDEGIEGTGEVGDADPFNAATDAIGAHGIDEVIISTLPADGLRLAAARPDRAARERDRPAGHARRGRRRLRGPAVRRHARAGQPDRRRRRARPAPGEARRRGAAPLHRGRSAGLGRRPRGARRARAAGAAAGVAALGQDRGRRHDRRPRPVHGRDERPAVLPHLGGRDLDAALQPLRVGREGPDREDRARERQAGPARRGQGRASEVRA